MRSHNQATYAVGGMCAMAKWKQCTKIGLNEIETEKKKKKTEHRTYKLELNLQFMVIYYWNGDF